MVPTEKGKEGKYYQIQGGNIEKRGRRPQEKERGNIPGERGSNLCPTNCKDERKQQTKG